MDKLKLIIGSRHSRLALWQANHIKQRLEEIHPTLSVQIKEITTKGDRVTDKPLPQIGGKGLFTAELEEALRDNSIDLAVHSLKDLPTEMSSDFTLGATPERESPFDALISRENKKLMDLPRGALVGSSSLRRVAQLLRIRPDLRVESIRGNVDTRIDKLTRPGSEFQAVVLAEAGIKRLGRAAEISQIFRPIEMLSAPAQGALGIQCRAGDSRVLSLASPLHCKNTHAEVTAERSFLSALGAGCSTPVAALARCEEDKITFEGRCLSPDGKTCIEVQGTSKIGEAEALGKQMAEKVLKTGFRFT